MPVDFLSETQRAASGLQSNWGRSDSSASSCLALRRFPMEWSGSSRRSSGSNRSGSPYCPDPQQRPHGLASGHRVQPTQPDRNADRSLEERDRPQVQISQLLQANHGDPGRPESSEHNDRTRAACVRTHRLTLPLGNGRIPSPPDPCNNAGRSPGSENGNHVNRGALIRTIVMCTIIRDGDMSQLFVVPD